jgi:hypothetical protein
MGCRWLPDTHDDVMSYRWLRALVVVTLVLPAPFMLVLLGGGERVSGCLAQAGCPPSIPGPIPFAGTAEGARLTVAALALAWCGLVAIIVVVAWIRSGPAMISVLRQACAAAVLLGVAGVVLGWASDGRLRSAAIEGLALAGVALVVVVWLGAARIAWSLKDD